jgi:hypothetical protein
LSADAYLSHNREVSCGSKEIAWTQNKESGIVGG